MNLILREAQLADLEQIRHIYNHEIEHGFATWNTQPYDQNHFQRWFGQLQQHNFPLFVVEDLQQQCIAGYAEYSTFRNISGFKQTVEHAVYINPAYARQGLGLRLLQHLIDHARQQQIHVMVAAIDHDNQASIHLHQKLGFQQTGYMPEVGKKFGQWRDLVLLQLIL